VGLFCEELVDAVGVKSDQDLVADDECWRNAAVVCPDKLKNGSLIGADIFFGELNSSSLEDRPDGETRCSTGLREEYHLLGFAHGSPWVVMALGRRSAACMDSCARPKD
jgi:hypothetical protein